MGLDGLDEKSIYLRRDAEIIGLHSVGYSGHYEYMLIELDETEVLKTSDFMPLQSWGNEYDENYNMVGRGSFRLNTDFIEDVAKDLESDGWVIFERK
jgi:hypothetical protein